MCRRRNNPCFSLLLTAVLILQISWLAFLLVWEQDTSTTCQCPHVNFNPDAPLSKNSSSTEQVQISRPSKTKCFLLVMVLSAVNSVNRRNAIRETWMARYGTKQPSVVTKFIIGTEGLPLSHMEGLVSEQSVYSDLVFLPDLTDSYSNLTRKLLGGFVWVHRSIEFSNLLKADDDTFLMLDTIVSELQARDSKRSLYWGFFDGRATPKRRGKWTEGDWFLCDHYLPYALGGGYVLSGDLVQRMVVNAEALQHYSNEDVSVGVWLSAFNTERRHDVRFNTEYVSRGCRNEYIVSHKQSTEDMYAKHNSLRTHGMQCITETQTRPSYEYNWNEIPSKCCQRTKEII